MALVPPLVLTSGSEDLVVPLYTAADLSQTYEALGGYASHRMLGGSGRRQRSWQKIATDVSGNGTVPPALADIDITQTWTMKCVAPRVASAEGNVILVPAYRSDVPLQGFVVLPTGLMQETGVGMAGQLATLTVVAGALGYRVKYWPQLTVICDPLRENVDVRGSAYGWSLHAEEA